MIYDYKLYLVFVNYCLCENKWFAGHTGVVAAAAWLPSGDQILTASWDQTACLWDANTGGDS